MLRSFVEFGVVVVAVGAFYAVCRRMSKISNLGFKIGYFLYTKTKFGYLYYRREVKKAYEKFGKDGHSFVQATKMNDLTIVPLVMSNDNYGYLISDEQDGISILVDPADPDSVQRMLDEKNASPIAVLTTHKHWDHSAGNKEWKKRFPSIKIYGGKSDNIPSVTHEVSDGDSLEFGRLKISVFKTPGHTLGHVVYLLDGGRFGGSNSLFSGDHLFIGGIGRLFEGNASMMLKSLDVLTQLSDDTLLWPGHEYSLANLQFNVHLEPDNCLLQNKLKEFVELRKSRRSTCPSTFGEEKLYNPFLRTGDINLQKALDLMNTGLSGDELREKVLFKCRTLKDAFKTTTT